MENLINVNDIVTVENGEVLTTSYQVVEFFNKKHYHILRDIRKLDCSKEFMKNHFWIHTQKQRVGSAIKTVEYYSMDKDGFMFLVMGFTGKKAAQLKEAYINAFNWMYDQLTKGREQIILELQETIKQERISFQSGSQAGKALANRKKEKMINQSKINKLNNLLRQPDLFIKA